MIFKDVNRLQKFAMLAILLSVILVILGFAHSYIDYKDDATILNVHVLKVMNTYHDLNKNGMQLVYGTTGELFYHPKSFFEAMKYDHFGDYVANYLIFLILAVTIFILSLKEDQVFFSKETIMKFYGVLFFYIALAMGKWFLLDWIHNDFYNSTGHLFKLDIADDAQPNSWQLLTMLFMFTVTGIIRAGIPQHDKAVPA